MSEVTDRLKTDLRDEDYRYSYDEDFSNSRMAMQIKVVRESQDLTQVQLAKLSRMRQSRISALENINYSSWSVSTLRRLAKALGVRFYFGFESWGKLLDEVGTLSKESLAKPKFENDPAFQAKQKPGDLSSEDISRILSVVASRSAKPAKGIKMPKVDSGVSQSLIWPHLISTNQKIPKAPLGSQKSLLVGSLSGTSPVSFPKSNLGESSKLG